MRFMATEGSVTFAVFIEFLKRLLHKANRPVFLIVDNHSVHRAREVREFVRVRTVSYGCSSCHPTLQNSTLMSMSGTISKIIKLDAKARKTDLS